jgi:phosphoribosylformylglycinamidine cyclo-ligase
VRFGPWLPIEQAAERAPAVGGVLQARADGLLPLPRGKSAMVFYAATTGDVALGAWVRGPGGAALDRAVQLGARLVRFGETDDPAAALARLLRDFDERFGALPLANRSETLASSIMSTSNDKSGISYRDAGVDIDAGDDLVERIKPHVARTMRKEVLSGLGGFAGLCALPKGYQEPVLVACTDGVGTKLKLAFLTGKHDTVGIDLVAMNVNDMVVSGAEPLLFLDYFASGKLEVAVAEQVIAGIAEGCRQAGCALLGGETAELPGFYQPGEYDLAGFSVGVVERNGAVDGRHVAAGDVLLGLASSGFHSNGYSLVRRVFLDHAGLALDARPAGLEEPLGEALLRPTRIYVPAMRQLYAAGLLKGAAHITGGGLVDNPTRMLPRGALLKLQIDTRAWQWPALFRLIAELGNISVAEMRRTFNCGIGMIVCVAPAEAARAEQLLTDAGETVFRIGQVAAASAPDAAVEFLP